MATIGQADLKTNYPVVEGLEADEKHDGQENNLVPEEKTLLDSYGNRNRGLG